MKKIQDPGYHKITTLDNKIPEASQNGLVVISDMPSRISGQIQPTIDSNNFDTEISYDNTIKQEKKPQSAYLSEFNSEKELFNNLPKKTNSKDDIPKT